VCRLHGTMAAVAGPPEAAGHPGWPPPAGVHTGPPVVTTGHRLTATEEPWLRLGVTGAGHAWRAALRSPGR
jgi:hypothetical protein